MNTGTLARIAGVLGALAGAAVIGNAQPAQAATITVTIQNDLFAAGPTGCSLRRAINAANNNSDFNGCNGVGPYGNDVIVFDPAIVTVTLTINTGGGDNDSNGYRDLDIGDLTGGSLSIIGPPGGVAIVASAGLGDRVFDITPNAGGNVTMTNLIIVGGVTPATTYETGASDELCYRGGGGIRHRGGGQLTLSGVRIENNTARAGGGVCYGGSSNSRLSVTGSVIQGNATQGSDGGGILSAGPTLISGTRVLSNTAVISEAIARGGGGVYHAPPLGDAPLEVLGGSVSFNTARRITTTAEAHGGGIATRAPTTLTQVSIANNTLESFSPNAQGGGILSAGSLIANQTSLVGNVVSATAFPLGGGLYSGPGSLVEINGGFILSNTARRGGGWYNAASGALLIGSEVRFNRATEDGGGISNANAGNVGIANAVICDNRAIGPAATSGGGLNNVGSGASLYVQDSILCNNTAQSGGGAANELGAGLIMLRTQVSGNSATYGGGGIFHTGATLRVEASSITSNTASGGNGGGGLWSNASFSVLNSTFSANLANDGGGLRLSSGSGYLTYTTVASNTAGSGVYLSSGASLQVRATLLAGNAPGNCHNFSSTLASQNDNLSSDATCASLTASNDLTSTNPLLRPLGFASPFDFTPTHRPMPNSPALNRIPPARCIPTDQRNTPRPQNGACDVGAVELAVWRSYAPIARKP